VCRLLPQTHCAYVTCPRLLSRRMAVRGQRYKALALNPTGKQTDLTLTVAIHHSNMCSPKGTARAQPRSHIHGWIHLSTQYPRALASHTSLRGKLCVCRNVFKRNDGDVPGKLCSLWICASAHLRIMRSLRLRSVYD
jgi:hypothetical protein